MARKGSATVYSPKKIGCLAASFMDREAAIEAIEKQLDQFGQWGDTDETDERLKGIWEFMPKQYFRMPLPVVTVKTDNGLHKRVPGYRGKCKSIPHWGDAHALVQRYGL
jgi:hypothetical protein